jgi:hypothetical protein
MAGIATLASTVGVPNVYTRKLDAVASGLVLNWRNDSGLTCIVQIGYYIVTQVTTARDFDIGVTTTSGEQAVTIIDGSGGATNAPADTGTVLWSDGCDVIADGSYLTMTHVTTSTAATAVALDGYAVVKTWPVCSVT